MLEYTKYKRKASKNKEKNIDLAIKLLKPYLKKGDILIIKPSFNSIKIKLFNLSSYVISLFSKGMTHSAIYSGKGNIVHLEFRLKRDLRKITLRGLLREKYKLFKGFTIYVVQPKKYTNWHRSNVHKVLNELLDRGKEINFSLNQFFSMFYWTLIKGIKNHNVHKLKSKFSVKKGVCSTFIAHVLKKGGVNLGRRPLVGFLPSTFVFSKNFKTKKKIKI